MMMTENEWTGMVRYGVNISFSDGDRILMENVYVVKGYETKNVLFPTESWGLRELNKVMKKLQETGTTARWSGSIDSMQNIYFFIL